jgi:hypothetical protein
MTPTRFDAGAIADALKKEHGADALDFAVRTAKQHLKVAEWKSGALWLQVVNRLSARALSRSA